MGDRISIPALREAEPLNDAWSIIHGEVSVTIGHASLLALVEAVEAAQTVVESEPRVLREEWQRLAAALARFDFEEET